MKSITLPIGRKIIDFFDYKILYDDFYKLKIENLSEFEKKLINFVSERDAIIAGGYARYICDRSKNADDIDIFMGFNTNYKEFIKDFKETFKVKEIRDLKKIINIYIEETPHPIQIIFNDNLTLLDYKYNNREHIVGQLLSDFDIGICQSAILNIETAVVTNQFINDMCDNKIVVTKRGYTKSTPFRIVKYLNRGFDLSLTEALFALKKSINLPINDLFKLLCYLKFKKYYTDNIFGELLIEAYNNILSERSDEITEKHDI